MSDVYFKINIIDGAINLYHYHTLNPQLTIEESIKYLKSGPALLANYDYDKAKVLCELAGWESFNAVGSRQEQLQLVLMNLVLRLKPFWARISHLGRNKVRQILSQDQLQCLKYAGLLDECPSEETINWWEQLAKVFRAVDEEQNVKIGKEGELKTIELEKVRLAEIGIDKRPKWVAIEDITAGYDVLSYRRNNQNVSEIKIEVKAYTFGQPHFFLTRNEWEIALVNRDSYLFHIWDLTNSTLIEMRVDEMEQHIPVDQGLGNWEKIKVILQ